MRRTWAGFPWMIVWVVWRPSICDGRLTHTRAVAAAATPPESLSSALYNKDDGPGLPRRGQAGHRGDGDAGEHAGTCVTLWMDLCARLFPSVLSFDQPTPEEARDYEPFPFIHQFNQPHKNTVPPHTPIHSTQPRPSIHTNLSRSPPPPHPHSFNQPTPPTENRAGEAPPDARGGVGRDERGLRRGGRRDAERGVGAGEVSAGVRPGGRACLWACVRACGRTCGRAEGLLTAVTRW